MQVAAIVVNWNGDAHLPTCLGSLLDQDHDDLQIVVVDNASTDRSRAILESFEREGRVRVVWNATNRGFAGAANDGIAVTDAPAVLVANTDIELHSGFVSRALAALAAEPHRGAVQGKLIRTRRSPEGDRLIDTTGHVAYRTRLFRNRGEEEVDRGQWDLPGEVFGVSGALALYRRQMLDDVAIDGEIFDEDLFAFWEDVDLDWRAAMRGWSAWYEPSAVAEHERGGAGPRRTTRVEQLNFQNRLLTLVKCDSGARLVRHLPGITLTTVLKAIELLVTVPRAFVMSLGAVRYVPRMRAKRRVVMARATVSSAEVIDRWFGAFDYGAWVRTWWRRTRG